MAVEVQSGDTGDTPIAHKSYRTVIFVDFWNFQLNWTDRAGAQCDWPKLPGVLMKQAAALIAKVGTGTLDLEETRVYASYRPAVEANLKRWLDGFLARQPSFRVNVVERKLVDASIRCTSCALEIDTCANCGSKYRRSPEKGVDTAIVTDLLSLGWEGTFDVAILVSSDADHVPAVRRLQEKGLKVINAAWDHHGFDLATASWASFYIDQVMDSMKRPGPATPAKAAL